MIRRRQSPWSCLRSTSSPLTSSLILSSVKVGRWGGRRRGRGRKQRLTSRWMWKATCQGTRLLPLGLSLGYHGSASLYNIFQRLKATNWIVSTSMVFSFIFPLSLPPSLPSFPLSFSPSLLFLCFLPSSLPSFFPLFFHLSLPPLHCQKRKLDREKDKKVSWKKYIILMQVSQGKGS